MSEFRAGQQVVCEDNSAMSEYLSNGLIYTIRDVRPTGALCLEGVREIPSGFYHGRFRPLTFSEESDLRFYEETPEIADIRAANIRRKELSWPKTKTS